MSTDEYGNRYSNKTHKSIGRPITKIPTNFKDIYNRWKSKEISSNEAIVESGLRRSTFYSVVKEYEKIVLNTINKI